MKAFRCFLSTVMMDAGQGSVKPFSEMPGPKGLPLVGTLPSLLKGNRGKGRWLGGLQRQYGPIFRVRTLGNAWSVVTSSPVDAEILFRSEGKYPSRGHFEDNMKWIYRKLKSPMPLFFSKDEEWKQARSNAAKQVVPCRVGNFVEPLCDIAEELLSHLETIQDEAGNIQDIAPEMNKWAFQGVSYFVYGEKISIYSDVDPVQREFIKAALDYIHSLHWILRTIPLYRVFPTKPYRRYKRIIKRLQQSGQLLLDRRINEVKDLIGSGIVDESKTIGLLDQWLIEGKFTEQEALTQSYDMLAAGMDTTSNTASFLLYELAKHPEIQERLVQEISSVVGDKRHPSWDDLQRMSLARNCVKETMRMYSPLGSVSRVLEKDVEFQGYQVPAGTTVFVKTSGEEYFEAPREFRPDRWEGNDLQINPFSSLPFGFGPRACYGRRLAELELYILLAKMLMKFKLGTDLKEMKVKAETTLK